MKKTIYPIYQVISVLAIMAAIIWLCVVIFSPIAQTQGVGTAFSNTLKLNIFAIVVLILGLIMIFVFLPKNKPA